MNRTILLPDNQILGPDQGLIHLPPRKVQDQFAGSKIYVPAENLIILPKDRDRFNGSVVIHMPLGEAIDMERFIRDGMKRFEAVIRTRFAGISPAQVKLIMGRIRPIMGGAAASAWAMTNSGRTSLLNGTFDIDSDTWKTALFLSTSDIGATETTYAGVTNEHANANGYTTGGIATTLTLGGTTTVTVDISSDPVWTAASGSIIARFGVIYEVSGNVLVYATLDSAPADVTATDGNTLTVAAHASGVFTLT